MVIKVVGSDTLKTVRWEVTSLVHERANAEHPNQGMLRRGSIMLTSREITDATPRPKRQLIGKMHGQY